MIAEEVNIISHYHITVYFEKSCIAIIWIKVLLRLRSAFVWI